MKKFYYLVITFLILSINVSAQITIKEKVKIKPGVNIAPSVETTYTPCGPYPQQTEIENLWQVVWNGSSFYLDPYQQLFDNQGNLSILGSLTPDHHYNVVITQGQQYTHITKFGDEDTDPEIIQGDALYNVLGEDLAGTGDWLNTSCGTKERFQPPDYGLTFERDTPPGTEVVIIITDLTYGSSTNFHTIVEVPAMELIERNYIDYLLHYYSTDLDLEAEQISDCHNGCGGYLPTSVTFTLKIVEGQQYGNIYDIQTGQSGSYFTHIETDESWPGISSIEDRFIFVADGVQPDTVNVPLVTIRFTASDPDLGHVDYNYIIQYNETPPIEEGVIVSFEKPVLSPRDTTLINLKHIYDDGTVTDFPEWQSFEIGMLEGCEGGEILVGDSLGTYFDNVYQPIKFVAADSIETNSIEVKLRAGFTSNVSAGKIVSQDTIKNKKKYKPFKKKNIKESNAKGVAKVRSINKFNKKYTTQWQDISTAAANTESNFCFTGNFYSELLGDGDVVIEKGSTILLGETKYYQVGLDANGKQAIQEVKPDAGGVPHLNDGIPSNEIWGDDPVQIVSGDKLGVYWEIGKYPIYDDILDFKGMGDLDDGLIRLVGRFWNNDIEYKIKLTAKNGPETVSKEIKVVKPNYLGKRYNAIADQDKFPIPKDVFGIQYNLDELIIEYAGKYGIPPQLIKADIQKESINFNPSFRYEPFFDLWYLYENRGEPGTSLYLQDFQYQIKGASDVGTPAIPTSHVNVEPFVYSGYAGTIWDYFYKYSEAVNPSATYNNYPKRTWNKVPRVTWQGIHDKELKTQSKLKNPNAKNLAIEKANKWLKDSYLNGVMNSIAQTRISSSYGLMQILYTTAHGERGYPVDDQHLPEGLNVNRTLFDNAIPYLKSRLALELNINPESSNWENLFDSQNNWELGLEETYKRAFNRYNGATENPDIETREYGILVIDFNKKYDPLENNGE